MKKTSLSVAFVAMLGAATFSSCKKDKVKPKDNEGELITTVELKFTEQGTSTVKSFFFRDSDGEGGNAPTVHDEIILDGGKTYTCEVFFRNEAVNPSEDITEEIEDEGTDHQIYYEIDPSTLANIEVLDRDSNDLPLGLQSRWTTSGTGSGTLVLSLKHKPEQKQANDPVSKGETDVELIFTVKVQ